jgi:hypothetical protein
VISRPTSLLPRPQPARILLLLSSFAALAASGGGSGCRKPPPEPPRAERAILERRVEELEKLVARGRAGPVIPFDQALIAIDQSLLQKLLDAALPYQAKVSGRFRIRILTGTVTCEDGVALVQLRGRASFADRPEAAGFVEATVFGSLKEFHLLAEESTLRGRVDVIAFEMKRVNVMGGDNEAMKGLIRDLAQLRLEAFQALDYTFDIPVQLVSELVLPAFDSGSGVRLPEARIPLQAAVTNITAVRGRIWISIQLYDRDHEAGRTTVASVSPDSAR